MLELTQLFTIERNVFQRFVIVYKYIYFLNSDPITKGILQKMFDSTAKIIGKYNEECMDETEFLDVRGEAIFSREFWMYYTNLELIHDKMKHLKKCGVDDKLEFENLCHLFSKPYSKDMLDLSFTVVNSEVFTLLDRESFLSEDKLEGETYFDEANSILVIKGKRVRINKIGKTTNAHKILHHIFISNKSNLTDEFFYSEIAMDEFDELDYSSRQNNWRTYHNACTAINDKIEKQTESQIKEFLLCTTGKTGSVSLNKQYL